MLSVNQLKKLIPHGKFKEIASKAGVTAPAVSRFFSGHTKSSQKIHKAALAVALECRGEIKSLETELVSSKN